MIRQETSVLIVEPDLDVQRIYRQKLIHDPAIQLVGICSSMKSALTLLEQTTCDVIFTELHLPDGNGCELLDSIFAKSPAQNCVVFTAKCNSSEIARAIELGVIGFLVKSENNPAEISEYLRLVISGGSPISPSVARLVLNSLHRKDINSDLSQSPSPLTPENPLTERETQLLTLLSKGMSCTEIGTYLHISGHTVTSHLKKIYKKLHVHSRGEAVYEAVLMGILKDRK